MASTLRNVAASLYYRVFQIMRQIGFTVPKTGQSLVLVKGTNVPANTYGLVSTSDAASIPYPWLFFDEDGNVTNEYVKVYVGGTALPANAYTVNFRDAQVSLATSPGNSPVTADFVTYGCHILEAYPEDEWLKAAQVPVIAVFVGGQEAAAFHIGSNVGLNSPMVTIDILARNNGERQDIGDFLQKRIIRTDLVDISEHQALNYDGTIDPAYDARAQFVDYLRFLQRPSLKMLRPKPGASVKEKWRAILTFEVEYVE